ncbi:MAG: DUF3426 domain-containing protein [Kiloniellaceae bacterium]
MHLTCPSCATRFLVDPARLGPAGRKVRCGSCGHVWHAARPARDDAGVRQAAARPGDRDELPRRVHLPPPPGAPGRRGAARAVGWSLFLLVAGGLVAGFLIGRQQIVATVPAAAKLYELVGLPGAAAGAGLELRGVTSVRRLVDGERLVVIEGLVANVSKTTRPVPLLRASLTDADGEELKRWTFATAETTLSPGGTASFQTSAKNPPREGNLAIDFVAED